MKRILVFGLLLIALIGSAVAQKLAMDNAGKLYGYKNEDGSWKIAPIYQYAYEFQSGVRKYAVVKYDQMWGCIDVDGNMMIRNVFFFAEAADEAGRAWQENDELGKWIYPAKNTADNTWGFVNYFGQWQLQPTYEAANPFIGKRPKACASVCKDGRWGCIDGKGIMIINNVFLTQEEAELAGWQWIYGNSFNTWRYPTTDPNHPNRWGYVNYLGHWEIKPQYSDYRHFGADEKYIYTQAKQAGRWGNIDRQGRVISDFIFETQAEAAYALSQLEHHRPLDEWRLPVCDPVAGNWGFVNYAGEWVIKPMYQEVTNFANDTGNYATAKLDGFWAAITNTGENISEHVFIVSRDADHAGHEWDVDEELGHWLWPVQDTATHYWGYVDYQGNWVIRPTFEDAKPVIYAWNNRVAPVKVDNRWGCIDHTGQMVVKNIYNTSNEAYVAGRNWGEKHKF